MVTAGIISVVIGGHFRGGDHFDGGDDFGGGTASRSRVLASLAQIGELARRLPKSTYAKPVACKKASKNKFVLSSARDLQTSNVIFTVGKNNRK